MKKRKEEKSCSCLSVPTVNFFQSQIWSSALNVKSTGTLNGMWLCVGAVSLSLPPGFVPPNAKPLSLPKLSLLSFLLSALLSRWVVFPHHRQIKTRDGMDHVQATMGSGPSKLTPSHGQDTMQSWVWAHSLYPPTPQSSSSKSSVQSCTPWWPAGAQHMCLGSGPTNAL
jgi:hypothetical protein